jgi:hypothetical protein
MNGLEFLLILLVPLGVWIFSSIFRSDDSKSSPRPATANRNSGQRRPVSDLERFLEEARRRREASERRAQPEGNAAPRPQPQREVRPVPQREQRPARQPAPPPQRRSVETAAQRPRGPVLLEPVDDQRPAARSATPATPRRTEPAPAPVPVAVVAAPDPASSLALLPLLIPSAGAKPLSPALQQLRDLLRTPSTVGTAVILNEIFNRPLSSRRR